MIISRPGGRRKTLFSRRSSSHRISCFRANQSKSGNLLNFICGRLGLANLIVSENYFCDRGTLIPWFQTGVVYCECDGKGFRIALQNDIVILELNRVQTACRMPFDHYRRVDIAEPVFPNDPSPNLPI